MTRFTSLLICILFFLCLLNLSAHALDQESVAQLSQVTGIKPNRVAKIVELHEALTSATSLSRLGKYADAVAQIEKITAQNSFNVDDIRQAEATLFAVHKRASNYVAAEEVGKRLMQYHPGFKLWRDEAMILLSCQQSECDHGLMEQFIADYYAVNGAALPPKDHNILFLAVPVRVYEATGEIDRAIDLVERYYAYYFPKKGFKEKPSLIFSRGQEGVALLKEALLRDKQEGRNIYAQELINTTDHFGFV